MSAVWLQWLGGSWDGGGNAELASGAWNAVVPKILIVDRLNFAADYVLESAAEDRLVVADRKGAARRFLLNFAVARCTKFAKMSIALAVGITRWHGMGCYNEVVER